MIVSLVGMSGSGKTHWARRLKRELGFRWICCDDRIEALLAERQQQINGSGIHAVARWMGLPYEDGFAEAETLYRSCEEEVMQHCLQELSNLSGQEHLVLDTSGSVIYTTQELQKTLRELTTVVYLEVPESHTEVLYRRYLSKPKPLVWAGHFSLKPNETMEDALQRSYKELMSERRQYYRSLAHITLNYSEHHSRQLTVDNFISRVRAVIR